MTAKDTVAVFAILTAAYPYFYKDIRQDDEQMKIAVALWNEMLAEYDPGTVKIALKRLIAVHKEYPPTIGQLLESINIVSGHAAPDADEVWGEITHAIQDYGYNRAIDGIDSLSGFAREAVKALGWQALCVSENPEIDRAHFFRIYQAIKIRNDHRYILPKDVRAFITSHAGKAPSTLVRVPEQLSNKTCACQHYDDVKPAQSVAGPRGAYSGRNDIESILAQFRRPQTVPNGVK